MEHSTPTLAQIDAYEVPSFLALRISKIYDYPLAYCEGLIKEAKRMLYLSIVSKEAVAPSDRVDIAWHELLMFTMFYRDYATFIGGFIHHVPNPPPEHKETPETWAQVQSDERISGRETETYTATKRNYTKYFGEKPDPKFWP